MQLLECDNLVLVLHGGPLFTQEATVRALEVRRSHHYIRLYAARNVSLSASGLVATSTVAQIDTTIDRVHTIQRDLTFGNADLGLVVYTVRGRF